MKRILTLLTAALMLLGSSAWAQEWGDENNPFAADAPKYEGEAISLDFQDAPVRQIVQLIADVSALNVVINEEVQGTITLKLKDVPWDQALDLVLQMNGLGMTMEGNILRVNTLENLAKQSQAKSSAKLTKVAAEDVITRILPVNFTKAKDMVATVGAGGNGFLSARGRINYDERTNSLVIQDIESAIDEVVELVRRLDTPTPQVTIAARIVQVRPTFSRELGVQWGGGATYYGPTSTTQLQGVVPTNSVNRVPEFGAFTPGYMVNMPSALAMSGAGGGVGVRFGRLLGTPLSLDLRITAGQSQGLTKIISTPKVTVLDHQQATISQGESIPFQTISSEGTQIEFHDAFLELEVTPHITGNGMVSMEIQISKNLPGESRSNAGPSILRREAKTTVLVRDGETTVIGGIFERTTRKSTLSVPFFAKLPILGYLFRSDSNQENVEELLVFVTPEIVK